MVSMSKTSIFALNAVIFTGVLIQILRSRIEFYPKVYPTDVVGLVFSGIIHAVGLIFFHIGLPRPTAARSLLVAACVLNATLLLQLLFRGSKIALYSYLVNALWLAEIVMVGFTLVDGEVVTESGSAERRPLLEDLQGVEGQLDEVEKRIAELRARIRQQREEASS